MMIKIKTLVGIAEFVVPPEFEQNRVFVTIDDNEYIFQKEADGTIKVIDVEDEE